MAADVLDRSGGTDGGTGNSHDRDRLVRRYLSALDARKPGRTAARTAESVTHRMHQIDTLLLSADPVQKLHLTQERIDLHAEYLRLTSSTGGDLAELERAFIRVARAYADRHGLSFSAWRQIGVEADVLAKAGIRPHVKPARGVPASESEPKKYQPAAVKKPAPAPKSGDESSGAEPPAPKAAPAKASVRKAPPKQAPVKQGAGAKKAARSAKPEETAPPVAGSSNGSATRPTKKAPPATKPVAAEQAAPEQQSLPAEAHLLS